MSETVCIKCPFNNDKDCKQIWRNSTKALGYCEVNAEREMEHRIEREESVPW